MKAMLLAAGLGTRLRPLTDIYAKPAVPFLNIPLLYYPIALLENAGLTELVINAHYLPEQIATLARTIPGLKGKAHLSMEVEKPLGSGGGVWAAKSWLQNERDFLLANGDEVIIPSSPHVIPALLERHRSNDAMATIMVMRHPGVGTQFGGVWTTPDGRVHGFGKQKPANAPANAAGMHYIGVLALSSRVFKYLPEGESNLLYDALVAAIQDGERVQIHEDNCTWYETGNPKDFVEATELAVKALNNGREKEFLTSMARRFWPEFDSRRSLWTGAGTAIDDVVGRLCLTGNDVLLGDNVEFRGFSVIGDGASIGKSCVLEECVVLPGAVINDGTHLQRTIAF